MLKTMAELIKTLNPKITAIWAADCAEHVICYFNDKAPDDDRPAKAIKAARAWSKDEITVDEAKVAANLSHTAARNVKNLAAQAVARSAGHAAAVSYTADHALHTANYAANAAYTANPKDPDATMRERIWQYSHLLELKNTDK
jgi:hypothetical protein